MVLSHKDFAVFLSVLQNLDYPDKSDDRYLTQIFRRKKRYQEMQKWGWLTGQQSGIIMKLPVVKELINKIINPLYFVICLALYSQS